MFWQRHSKKIPHKTNTVHSTQSTAFTLGTIYRVLIVHDLSCKPCLHLTALHVNEILLVDHLQVVCFAQGFSAPGTFHALKYYCISSRCLSVLCVGLVKNTKD